jgi:hypothetical protein
MAQRDDDTHSTTPARPVKPGKPRPTFPLFAHANGQWCRTKRMHGRKRFFFFGDWVTDPKGEKAEELYNAVAEDIRNNREPNTSPVTPPTLITAGEVVDRFLVSQEQRVRDGEIGHREFDDIRRACLIYFLDAIPEHVPLETVDKIHAGQRTRYLDQFRSALSKRVGVLRFNNSLTKVRKMLKWAYRTAKIIRVPLHDDEALRKRTNRHVKRDQRLREQDAGGKPLFTPVECRMLVAEAARDGGPLLAFILLAMNAGMGQSHISALPLDTKIVDTAGLFVDWVRTKTEELFQFPLWPITAVVIEREMARRPKPKPDAAALLFVTKYGHPWVQEYVKTDDAGAIGDVNPDDAIGKAFDKLQKRLGIKRKGRGFYSLRRTFSTTANGVQDRDATRRIMGHGLEGMDPHYVREIPRYRLQAVVSHVGHVLLGCVAAGCSEAGNPFAAPVAPPGRFEPPARAAG